MSLWIRNLVQSLEDRNVIILHGNVRDRYIDAQDRVHANLTALIAEVSRGLERTRFDEVILYDIGSRERVVRRDEVESRSGDALERSPERSPEGDSLGAEGPERDSDLEATAPRTSNRQQQPPARTLARWCRELGSSQRNRLAVVSYLDKLVPYQTSYSDSEMECLLWLEKCIESIAPTNRLVLIALEDGMIPRELYVNAPTRVFRVPLPDKEDRSRYIRSSWNDAEHLDVAAELTDGLYLRDLDPIVSALREAKALSHREVRRIVNRYRIGDQDDHWSKLSIQRLRDASGWFVEKQGVKGQDEAIHKVVDVLCLARSGLAGVASGKSAKPKGILFFAGPTGVGKTMLAKKLAAFLFGTEDAFIGFDMSEYKEGHTVSKLIGAPPGYIGSDRGGELTRRVRERPFSVVLFDEIEKAHPLILDIFLQMLEEGRLTDSRGQVVFFTETVIVLTSNIGCRTQDSYGRPLDERERLLAHVESGGTADDRRRRLREHFLSSVRDFFLHEISRPELLNRIGNNVVPFNHIHGAEVQRQIVEAHLQRIRDEVADRFRQVGHRLEYDAAVVEHLVTGHGARMAQEGGRGIAGILEEQVVLPIAKHTLVAEEEGARNVVMEVRVEDGRLLLRRR